MIARYESRSGENQAAFWYGKYEGLCNLLHWHREIEIIHILHGCARVTIRGITYLMYDEQSAFVESGLIHSIISETADTIISVMIFDGDFLAPLGSTYKLSYPIIPYDTAFKGMYEEVKNELSQSPFFYEKKIQSKVMEYVIHLYRVAPYHLDPESDSQALDKIYRLFETIDTDYAFITFDEARAQLGYSPSHFSRVFLQLAGVTFTRYLNTVKIDKAIELLRHSDKKISDIAMSCGFNSIRQFNRVFKEVTGTTPKQLPTDYSSATPLRKGICWENDFNPTLPISKLLEDYG